MIKFNNLLKEISTKGYSLQLHMSDQREIEYNLAKDTKSLVRPNKPVDGFWTSTAYKQNGKYTSDWWEYAKTLHSSMHGDCIHLMTITGSPNILHLMSEEDFDMVDEKYGLHKDFEWKQIAKDYDAFHIGKKMARTGNRIQKLQGWDVESTVWFDPTFLKKQFTWKVEK